MGYLPLILFSVTALLSIAIAAMAGWMKERSPLAFRNVDALGFTSSAIFALELARSNGALAAVLNVPGRKDDVIRDVRRSLGDDRWFIAVYTLMLVAASGLLATQLDGARWLVFGGFTVLSVLAAGADVLENRGIQDALRADLGQDRDYARGIRIWSLVKWHLLIAVGLGLGAALVLRGGTGPGALFASLAGFLVLAFGGFCCTCMWRWWRASGR